MEKLFRKQSGIKRRLAGFAAVITGLSLMSGIWSGCGIEKTDGKKIQDMEYEMVEEEEIPEELKAKIEEKKMIP